MREGYQTDERMNGAGFWDEWASRQSDLRGDQPAGSSEFSGKRDLRFISRTWSNPFYQ